jgi:hypothetical protein
MRSGSRVMVTAMGAHFCNTQWTGTMLPPGYNCTHVINSIDTGNGTESGGR